MNRSEYSILAVTATGHIICHWCMLVVTGLLITLRTEFNLSESQVTDLPWLGYLLMGMGAIPAGIFADRFGPKKILVLYFFLTSLACVSVSVASTARALGAGLTFLGAAVSLYHPSGLSLISQGIRHKGKALGIHGLAGSLGLIGSSLGAWALAIGNWRYAYMFLAAIALFAAVALFFLPIELKPTSASHTGSGESQNNKGNNSLLRLIVLLYLAMMLGGFNYRALTTALPTFLAGILGEGVGPSRLAAVLLAVFLAGGIGQLVVGRKADKTNPVKLYVTMVGATIPIAVILCLAGNWGNIAFLPAVALAFLQLGTQPVENLLIAQNTPASRRSMSYGFKFFLTFGIGATGTKVVGIIWEQTGTHRWTFLVIAGVAAIVTCLVLALVKIVNYQSSATATAEVDTKNEK